MPFLPRDLVWVPGIVVFPKSEDAPSFPACIGRVFPGTVVLLCDPDHERVVVDVGYPISDEIEIEASVLEFREAGDWERLCMSREISAAQQSEQEARHPSSAGSVLPGSPGLAAASCSELVGSGEGSRGVPGEGSLAGADHEEE